MTSLQQEPKTALTPLQIAPPFGRYSHGIAVAASGRLVVSSGQLGLGADGCVPESVTEQARICFANCAAILAQAGAGPQHVIRINAYLTRREDFPAYMAVRDAFLAEVSVPPASTLLIVTGFTRPEFLVEVEVTALVP